MFLKVKNIIALLYSQKLYTNFKPVWIRYSFTLIHPWNGSHAKHTNKYRKFRWFPLANSKLLYYSALPPIFCIHFHRCCYLSVYMSVCECVCVVCVYVQPLQSLLFPEMMSETYVSIQLNGVVLRILNIKLLQSSVICFWIYISSPYWQNSGNTILERKWLMIYDPGQW